MFSKDKRTDKAHDDAGQARDRGAEVYAPYFYGGHKHWGDLIEAVETAGWTLTHWSVDQSIAYPVFRRQ